MIGNGPMELSEQFRLCQKPRLLPPTSALGNKPGVYVIIGADKKETPVQLNRVCGPDAEGILYIGKSTTVRSRLQKFRNLVCPDAGQFQGHAGAESYRENTCIKKMCGPEFLMFRYALCEDCDGAERELIRTYLDLYGEVPPLNFTR